MTLTEKHIIRLIKNKIMEQDPLAKVILYGSRARGEARNDSDWDILILLKGKKVSRKTEQSFRHQLLDLELEISQPISVFVRSEEEWESIHSVTPLFHQIKIEGKYIS
ncbi:MAG: nucleotidyltransferase domain-containing protein [Bacteroidales bacterium]|nr:nucleotidyltransferase domain-containing protein [Bacteroidales bacterium]